MVLLSTVILLPGVAIDRNIFARYCYWTVVMLPGIAIDRSDVAGMLSTIVVLLRSDIDSQWSRDDA